MRLYRTGDVKIVKFQDGKIVEFPALFPVVNFITGSPGILKNGGIWRFIKKGIVEEINHYTYMTQVLHFTDFGVSKNVLNKWFSDNLRLIDWIKSAYAETGDERVESFKKKFVLFADSGGFKLLYNTSYNLSHLGLNATPESILDLQVNKFGANLVATLDYPVPPSLTYNEREKRFLKSIDNAIKTLNLIKSNSKFKNSDVLPFLAVHGHNEKEIKSYLGLLWKKINEEHLDDIKFGLAVGSLVPVKNNSDIISEVVLSVIDFLKKNDLAETIPVHVFGITGYIMPYLLAYGVDSFDSCSYSQAAANLKIYVENDNRLITKPLKEITMVNDNITMSPFLETLQRISLKRVKKILESPSYKRYKIPALGVKLPKSFIYAQIALHNLYVTLRFFEKFKNILVNDGRTELIEYLEDTTNKNKIGRILLKKLEMYQSTGYIEKNHTLVMYLNGKISLERKPDEIDFSNYKINTNEKIILLLLQCTKTKPYSKSVLHKKVMDAIEKYGIPKNKIYKVTLSGLYGPIPEKFEKKREILTYDFRLTKYTSQEQIKVVTERLKKFIETNKDNILAIVAFMATKPYLEIVQRVSRSFPNLVYILPKKINRHISSELTKDEHINELIDFIIKKISE